MSSLVQALPATLDGIRADEAEHVGAAVVDLLEAMLSARLGRLATQPTRHAVLLQQIFAHIDRNLHRPDLSPFSIAAAHHISVRLLHKLFETQPTTVSACIRQRRLDRCARDLRDAAQAQRSAASIAARWGFADPASFSRLFKTAYGVSPTDYRDTMNVR